MHIEVQEGVMMSPNAMAKFDQSSCIFAFPPSTCQAAHKDNGLKNHFNGSTSKLPAHFLSAA